MKDKSPEQPTAAVPEKVESKMGRPPIPIDFGDLDSLCQMHCTQAEMAFFFKCDTDTINNHVKKEKGMTFSAYYKQVSVGGRLHLRRVAWKLALERENAQMVALLLKQKESKGGLGFSEKVTNEHEVGQSTYERLTGICDELEAEKAIEENA